MTTPNLFRGEVVHVWPAGFSPEEAQQLREAVVTHGAELWDPVEHQDYADALLVKDASVLVPGGAKDWLQRVDTAIALKSAWVTDSIRLGQKLNGADYKVTNKPLLFRGEVVHVWCDGFTDEEAQQLREAVVAHGAELWNSVEHQDYADALLVKDAYVLSGFGLVNVWLQGFDTAVVLRSDWVTDSIRDGRKLNGADYKVEYERRC